MGASGALPVGLLAGYMHQHVPTVMLSNIVLKRNGNGALWISKQHTTDRAPDCNAIFDILRGIGAFEIMETQKKVKGNAPFLLYT